jgi:hypothetical protein
MTVLTQPPTMGDVLKYEVNPNYHPRDRHICWPACPTRSAPSWAASPPAANTSSPPDTAADGAETATAVLLYAVDATLADATGIIVARGPCHRLARGARLRRHRR